MDFRILGPFEVWAEGTRVQLGRGKERALLALLLLNPNRVVSLDRLIESLWGESPPETASGMVQNYVSRLRRRLGPERLVTRPPGYLLQLDLDDLDLGRFERLTREASERRPDELRPRLSLLEQALGEWRGDPLGELTFEPFAMPEIARLEELRLSALAQRLTIQLELGRHDDVLAELTTLVERHPLHEDLHALLMRALYGSGRQVEALESYQRAREALLELGIEPSAELRRLEQEILTQSPSVEAPRVPPARWDFPLPATPLVGRRSELEQAVLAQRAADTRLLTLTGPGGIGKTRLAFAVADAVRRDFPGGGVFVSLAPVSDEAQVPGEIARAVGAGTGLPVLDSILRAIGDSDFLLVLDNLEHVVGCAPFVSELLAHAPRLSVLATSRERLAIPAEHVYPVPPLQPAEAVALFTARAQAVAADFLPEEDGIAALCARLDGLPLAIELASAWAAVMSPAELASRLSLRLLDRGAGDAPDRQQALAATIDWSHRLLNDAERALFASIAVFHGGCTVASAEDLCRTDVRAIAGLVEKSLLVRTGGRLTMLETIREYALERLMSGSELEELSERHFAHFLALAEEAELRLARSDQKLWFELLESELPNLRAAQAWSLARGDGERTARLGAAVWEFLWSHGYLTEAFEWLQAAEDPSLDRAVRLRALAGWSGALMAKGAFEEAERAAEARLALAHELESPEAAAGALTTLATIAVERGQLQRSVELRREAVELGRQVEHGRVHRHLNNLGGALLEAGDSTGAQAAFGESLSLARRCGDSMGIAHATGDLGLLALEAGRVAEASALLHESAELFMELGDRYALPYTLLSVAELLIALERPADSALLLGAFSAYVEVSGGKVNAYATEQAERARGAARSALGDPGYEARETAGRDLTLAQAVEQWLAQSSSWVSSDSSSLSSSLAGARSTP